MKQMLIRSIIAAAFVALALSGQSLAQEFTFKVEHDHLYRSCKGELTIGERGVEYKTANKGHARKWSYQDIKMIKLESTSKIEILTYESSKVKLGRDHDFEFKVIEGEISKEVSDFLLSRVGRPVATSFVNAGEKGIYEFAVRHRHRLGDCEGTLRVFDDKVVYESQKAENSRQWRVSDIRSISREGTYRFSITTFEPQFGGPTRAYNFDLKEGMEDEAYDFLWALIYRPTLPSRVDVRSASRRR